MKKLPIGIQTFEELINEGYLYVDKTKEVIQLTQAGKFVFLSRPRRFGKSLLVSTLKALYEGKKSLFKNTYLFDRWDWDNEKHPVIHLDFNLIDYQQKGVELALKEHFIALAAVQGFQLQGNTAKDCFGEWVQLINKKGSRPVVLIDEYDKPITDYLQDKATIAQQTKALKNIYSSLKSMDHLLHFVFVTGVSKFAKVSIFSDLNNLKDITLHHDFATLLGYTQEELEHYFLSEQDSKEKIEAIQYWYNGYSWDGERFVYNPFSILNYFDENRFQNYWFDTGTPTFLVEMLKKQQLSGNDLEYLTTSETPISTSDIHQIDVIGLLFQTGYLTIKHKTTSYTLGERFVLSYPNNEVRHSLATYLLAAYTEQPINTLESKRISKIRNAIEEKNWDELFQQIQSVLGSIPYQVFHKAEDFFHAILHTIFTMTGLKTEAEVSTNIGRADHILSDESSVYVFEYKVDSSAEKAIEQIIQKKYAQPFQHQEKSIYAIGINFSSGEKNIRDWKVVEMGKGILALEG